MPALDDLASVSVLLLLHRRPRPIGCLILVFAIWYGTGRIIEDFFRVDVTHGTGLTGSQWTACIALIAATGHLAPITRSRRSSAATAAQDHGERRVAHG